MSRKGLILLGFLAGLVLNTVTFVALPTASAWTPWRKQLLIKDGLAVRIADAWADAMLAIQSDGTKDIISGYNSAKTEVFTVDASGDVTITQTLAVTGTTAFTGALTVNYINGIEALDFDAQTADPCPGWGSAAPGRIFYSNADFYCRCDASTDDIKGLGDGDTDACTY